MSGQGAALWLTTCCAQKPGCLRSLPTRLDGACCHGAAGEKMLLVGKSQHLGFECQARTRAGV